ncbi:Flp pilus assembly protein TadD, contains TPR repeats [Pseudomonas antarctica]|uniref:Flp pilus assembly protein TadD, contains TPR repeats n=1 Tax=Pseudomonas antarctica TaxID=219572 RepID=A0A1H0AAA9_9PSED|nr:dsDNA nuclease domain-containing protein [Pseudomonas antarctica]KAF2407197.1 TPR repeat-containing protein YrrB [Pseudomonas antarctica]SDN30490.1 Flp pilus assembly protein TadD, contains TPR repeats [Pseudomonas antarctica]
MTKDSYFGKVKTGGANASAGFSFQDACALYHLIKTIDEPAFLALGLENDDDFTLAYSKTKIFAQVKLEELSIPLARAHLGENKILIGSTLNKSLSTFLTYLAHYRNFMKSAESTEAKLKVTQDFEVLRLKHNLSNVPDSWQVDTLPDTKIEELIQFSIMSWGLQTSRVINTQACLQEFLSIIAKKRVTRGFLDKKPALDILYKHSKPIDIGEALTQQNYIDRIGIKKEAILDKVDTKINNAEQFLKADQYSQALEIYINLAAMLESEQLYLKCASIYHVLNEHDHAIAYCDKALKTSPHLPYAQAIKGSSLGEQGRYAEAIDFLKSANHNLPDDAVILYNLGVSFLKLGKIPDAINYFEHAIGIDKTSSSAHLNLGICLFNQQQYSKALEHIEMSLLLEPGMPEAISQKAEIKRFYGEFDEAQALFERGLTAMPDNPLNQRGLAFCLLAKGDLLGAPILLKYCAAELDRLKHGRAITLMDSGLTRTIAIAITRIDELIYEINYNGASFRLAKPAKDTIGITADNIAGLYMPLIIKSYERECDYNNALTQIKLNEMSHLVCIVDGVVNGLGDHCEIRINFKNFSIHSKTDPSKNEGFNAFKSAYQDHCMLLLQHEKTDQSAVFNLVGLQVN